MYDYNGVLNSNAYRTQIKRIDLKVSSFNYVLGANDNYNEFLKSLKF